MTYLIRTNQAEEDLIEIWLYIATDNQIIADRILDQKVISPHLELIMTQI